MGVALESAACCQVEVSAKGRSLLQRNLTDCGVSFRNFKNEATLARVGLLGQRGGGEEFGVRHLSMYHISNNCIPCRCHIIHRLHYYEKTVFSDAVANVVRYFVSDLTSLRCLSSSSSIVIVF